MSKRLIFLASAALALLSPTAAHVHPHVFVAATMKLDVDAAGTVEKFRHLWVFDDVFSSSVLIEFDKNLDLKLDGEELDGVEATIMKSIGEFNYFQVIQNNGKEVRMSRPPNLSASMNEQTLMVSFESAPEAPLALRGDLAFSAYDPTSYTAIDFKSDGDLSAATLPDGCVAKVVRPVPEAGLEKYKAVLADPAFASAGEINMGAFVATRLEVTCPK